MLDEKELVLIFKTETKDRLTKLDKGLVSLEKKPDDLELVHELNRESHTIKGAARVFGFSGIQEIMHRIESIFDEIGQQKLAFNAEIANKVFKGLDIVRIMIENLGENFNSPTMDVDDVCRELDGKAPLDEEAPAEAEAEEIKEEPVEVKPQIKEEKFIPPPEPEVIKQEVKKQEPQKPEPPQKEVPKKAPPKQSPKPAPKPEAKKTKEQISPSVLEDEYIRIPLSRINRLLNLVGELVISKLKFSQKVVKTRNISKILRETRKTFVALSEKIGSNPALQNDDITKFMTQCSSNLGKLSEDMAALYEDIASENSHLDPVIDELQAKIKEIRMLPCATVFEGFPRMVRDIAFQEKKEVTLEIIGAETELDKKVLEGVKAPLLHVLRNCIDHGIEEPSTREAIGKPRNGTIALSASHEAGNVIITIEDDGRGIDPEDIKKVALRKHLVSEEDLEELSDKELINLVFMNGFSTSPIITDISGRGLGLDIARQEIQKLKGQIMLETEKDKGTKFTFLLPLTIAIIQVLILKTRSRLYAFPMASIAESLMVSKKDISTIERKMAIQVRGNTVPVVYLADVLQLPQSADDIDPMEREKVPVIIATSLDKRVGFIIDEIVGEQEIFIKTMGEHLGKIRDISGAAILGTGEVLVVLDVAELISHSSLCHPALVPKKAMPEIIKREKRILVVEDDLSIRELEKKILESEGYVIDTAVNGLDGLSKVSKTKYDLIISDVMMPKMTGFEFCKALKENSEHKDIPVIILTSLEKEEDKRRGIEVGASAYVVKGTFNQNNLLDTIERLIN